MACLNPVIDYTTIRQLSNLAKARLAMSGRITMRGISRWTEKHGSYRTLQRCCSQPINGGKLRWLFSRRHLIDSEDVVVIAGDEVVVTKSGKKTYGLGRFFSSLYGKTVPSLGCLSWSLLSVKHHRSYPLMMEPVTTKESKKNDHQESSILIPKKGQRGRPKGSGNNNRKPIELSPYWQFVPITLKSRLNIVGTHLNLVYFVFDGAFGNNDALPMVRLCH